jgi:hypothetical protein
MIPQLNKITHTKKVAALSIVMLFLSVKVERRARIELATLAWKAKVIPFYERRVYFNYTTNITVCLRCLAGDIGFEPMRVGIKIRCLNQLGESPTELVANTRFELVTNALSTHCSTPELIGYVF